MAMRFGHRVRPRSRYNSCSSREPVGAASVSELEESINGCDADWRRRLGVGRSRVSTVQLIWSRPLKYDGVRFVIIGEIADYQGLSLSVRKARREDVLLHDGVRFHVRASRRVQFAACADRTTATMHRTGRTPLAGNQRIWIAVTMTASSSRKRPVNALPLGNGDASRCRLQRNLPAVRPISS